MHKIFRYTFTQLVVHQLISPATTILASAPKLDGSSQMPSIRFTFQLIICSSRVLPLYSCHSTYHLICCIGPGQPRGCTSTCQSLQVTVRAIQRTNHATPKKFFGCNLQKCKCTNSAKFGQRHHHFRRS